MSKNHLKQPKTITPRKSQRQIKASKRYGFDIVSYALQVAEYIDSFELSTYQKEISYSEAEEGTVAMNEEMKSLQKSQTWDLVELLEGR